MYVYSKYIKSLQVQERKDSNAQIEQSQVVIDFNATVYYSQMFATFHE